MKITKAVIHLRNHACDRAFFHTDLPPNFPAISTTPAAFVADFAKGTAEAFIQANFPGVAIDIIEDTEV